MFAVELPEAMVKLPPLGELQSVFSPRTFNTLRFQFSDEGRPRQGNDVRPALIVNLAGGEQIAYGGTFVSYLNNLEESKFQLIENLTHTAGNHTLKVGANAMFTHIFNRFISNGAGEYSFASLADFQAFRPTSYTRFIREGGGVPVSEFDVVEWALYAQDEGSLTPRLALPAARRYRLQSAPPRTRTGVAVVSGCGPRSRARVGMAMAGRMRRTDACGAACRAARRVGRSQCRRRREGCLR
jgi:hypothetical protein